MQVMQANTGAPTDKTERVWSYTSGTSDSPLLGLTIGDLFDQSVEKYPENPALISRQQKIRLSYRELQKEVNQCAKGLMHLGLQKGQRIGIWSPNRAEWCDQIPIRWPFCSPRCIKPFAHWLTSFCNSR